MIEPIDKNSAATIDAHLDAIPVNDDWGVTACALLLSAAWEHEASDLHVVCQREEVVIRLRKNSDLREIARLSIQRRDLLLARFKVMARLPAFVRHEPQDGRIDWMPPGASRSHQLRVSFLPTIHGETLVIRFPEGPTSEISFGGLGLREDMRFCIERLLGGTEGVFLVTGPSGSGKTTTLYAMVKWLHENRDDLMHVVTIEDPVERDLGFASQVQADEAKGVDFARGLRAAMRQDPNVILIGEIRDLETARIAMQAGMTGHLVLSSLHAGRAGRVPSRLISMGVDRFSVASALGAAIAQRLVLNPESGGRRAVFELGVMTESARDLILEGAAPDAFSAEFLRTCPGTLSDEARRLVDAGEIAAAAARRLIELEDFDR